ncbi:MAG: penicillin-binding protein activator [Rickettsiales bacterium]|jgi:ABC-type branched-subunit amino acid transport system substrate-binding protein|nr:penicillin-binding protein activator [Rickettsiales bacterium]
MFKKLVSLLFISLFLAGCPAIQSPGPQKQTATHDPFEFEISELVTVISLENEEYEAPETVTVIRERAAFINRPDMQFPVQDITQVAIFLPLTGNGAKIGQSMKKALQLSLSTADTNKIKYQFFDTKSSPEGTMEALRDSQRYKIDLIIGPVYAQNVRAIKDLTNVPILSFTTDSGALSNKVFSLGLLQEEEVRNLEYFMKSDNASDMIAFLPNTQMGRIYGRELNNYNIQPKNTIYYTPGNIESVEAQIRKITKYDDRKKQLEILKKEIRNNPNLSAYKKDRELKKLENKDTAGDVDFDSVFITGDINDSKLIVSYFQYFEADPKKVKYYGTSTWNTPKILNDPNFINVNFVNLNSTKKASFEKTYNEKFGERPEALSSFAYDAGKIVQFLSQGGYFDLSILTSSSGFNGINGTFRILPTGKSQYQMELQTITGRDAVKISKPAKEDFR